MTYISISCSWVTKTRILPWLLLINKSCKRKHCQKELKTRLLRHFPLKSLNSIVFIPCLMILLAHWLSPYVFFTFLFSSPIISYFPKNVNRWAYHLHVLFIFCLHPLSTMLGILTLQSFGFGTNTFPHSTISVLIPKLEWTPYRFWDVPELEWAQIPTQTGSVICRS